MKISIRIKFSVFLAALLLLTVSILSLLVLKGIKNDQRIQYEGFLSQQAKIANLFLAQSRLAETITTPSKFLSSRGKELAKDLEMISGQVVVLYDKEGKKVGESISESKDIDLETVLYHALNNKIAYEVAGESLYYMTPLIIGREQVGVIQLYYSLERNIEFYNYIKTLFICIGAIVFGLSFILGYIYFNSFTKGILKLKKMTDKIKEGDYNTQVLPRHDELGELSEGVFYMSKQIMKTIGDMEKEQNNLKLAVQKLSRLEKEQKQFIGNVTHEFKTPLTSTKAYLDLIEMYPEDKDLLEIAKRNIKNETEKLYKMVDKVLELSALEKYGFEYNIEKVDIQQAILKVCSSLKGKMDKFGIRLETNLVEGFIEGDRESINTILVNLLDNAIKYNKPNGSIAVKNYLADSKMYVEICDTGRGIPEDGAQKIFEPFYTLDKNRSRENGGVGLGLSIVKKLIEKHRGGIILKKTGVGGSIFQISLPVYSKENK